MNQAYLSLLDPLGISFTQYLVLLVLWEDEGVTVGRIGARLHLDVGTLSPVLKRLELAGLVTKQRDLSDERGVLVGLTEQGHALNALTKEIPETMRRRTGLPTEQLIAFCGLLQHLTQNLNPKSKQELR